jgi:hypothetical protein
MRLRHGWPSVSWIIVLALLSLLAAGPAGARDFVGSGSETNVCTDPALSGTAAFSGALRTVVGDAGEVSGLAILLFPGNVIEQTLLEFSTVTEAGAFDGTATIFLLRDGSLLAVDTGTFAGQLTGDDALSLTYSATLLGCRVTGSFTATATTNVVSAAVLPSSRAARVGVGVTVFATIVNPSATPATGCRIAPLSLVPVLFSFQATDPRTNQPLGVPDTPVDIAPGAARSFVLTLTPFGPIEPRDVLFVFACASTGFARAITGVNTLALSAAATPTPDIVALAATAGNDGVVAVDAATRMGAFAVATVNLGAGGSITVSADVGGAALPVGLTLCQTDPASGACLAPPRSSLVAQIAGGATPTFAVFVTSGAPVAFAPDASRVFVRFRDAAGVTRGSTSVAVRAP